MSDIHPRTFDLWLTVRVLAKPRLGLGRWGKN